MALNSPPAATMIVNPKPSKRPLVFIFVCGVIVSMGMGLFFFWMRDSAWLTQTLSTFVSQQLNTLTTSKKIELNLFPLPCLTVTGLDMEIGGSHILVDTTLVYPDLLDLVTGKINISRIRFKTIQVLTSTTSPGNTPPVPEFHLPQLPVPGELFALLPPGQHDLLVKVENFQHHSFARMDGSMVVSPEQKKITGELTVKNLTVDNTTVSRLIPNKTVSTLTAALVKVRFSATQTSRVDVELAIHSPEICSTAGKTPEISGEEITAKAVVTDKHITLSMDSTRFDPPGLTLGVDFEFDRVTNNARITFLGENIQVGPTRSTALALFKDNPICRELFWILRGGVVPRISVSFTSSRLNSLFNPHTMVITGAVKAGVVRIPQTQLTVSKINGLVTMEKGILTTQVTHGDVNRGTVRKGNLDVDILGKTHGFKGEFDLFADLNGLCDTLKILLPEGLLTQELDRCDNISGTAHGTLKLESIDHEICVSVKADSITLEGDYDRIPGSVQLKAETFTFQDEYIFIKGLTATSRMGVLSNVNGRITLGRDPLVSLSVGSSRLDLPRLFDWLTRFKPIETALSPVASAQGRLLLDQANLEGPILRPQNLAGTVNGSFVGLGLAARESPPEISNASGRFMVSADSLHLTELAATIHSPRFITAMTRTPYLDELSMPLTLSRGVLQAKTPGMTFNGELEFKNQAVLFLSVANRDGHFLLDQATLTDKQTNVARITSKDGRFIFEGRLDTPTLEGLLNPGSHALKELIRLTGNTPFTVTSDPENTPVLSTGFLDLDTIKTARTTTADRLLPENVLPPFILKASTLKYHGRLFNHVEARITVGRKKTEITILQASGCTIDFTGTIVDQDGIVDVHFSTNIKDRDLDTTLSCLHGRKGLISGHYSLQATLESSGNPASLLPSTKGRFTLSSPKGRIYKLTLLSRILSVINVATLFKGQLPNIEQDGFAYNALTLDGDVNQGRIIFTNAVIDGQDMTLIFNGWIDPEKDQLALIFLVAPFKTADILIEKIPVLGSILQGRLVSIPVKAAGTINNPDVFLLPPAEVGKGLVGTMQRLLETPFKLIEKLPGI